MNRLSIWIELGRVERRLINHRKIQRWINNARGRNPIIWRAGEYL